MASIFELIVYFGFFCTGELILYLLSVGKREPRWKIYERTSAFRKPILMEISFWLGFLFWILFSVLIIKVIPGLG